jgi:hypothetical protein
LKSCGLRAAIVIALRRCAAGQRGHQQARQRRTYHSRYGSIGFIPGQLHEAPPFRAIPSADASHL